jgi:hypothetical protein
MNHEAVRTDSLTNALLKSQYPQPAAFIIHCEAPEAWNFAIKIRQTPSLQKVPILLTGERVLSERELATAIVLRAQGFIPRPVLADMLRHELEHLFANRKRF